MSIITYIYVAMKKFWLKKVPCLELCLLGSPFILL